ncbi:MAG: hypothetical protein ACI4TK_15730 [Agathobacter sp.]
MVDKIKLMLSKKADADNDAQDIIANKYYSTEYCIRNNGEELYINYDSDKCSLKISDTNQGVGTSTFIPLTGSDETVWLRMNVISTQEMDDNIGDIAGNNYYIVTDGYSLLGNITINRPDELIIIQLEGSPYCEIYGDIKWSKEPNFVQGNTYLIQIRNGLATWEEFQ